MTEAAKKALIVGGVVVGAGAAGGLVYYFTKKSGVSGSVPGLSIGQIALTSQCAPLSGGVVTVGQHIELSLGLTNTSGASEVGAVEAVSAAPDGTIVDVWFSNNHPSGAYPQGLVDDPAWFQNAVTLAAGQTAPVTGTDYSCGAFGSVFQAPFPGTTLSTAIFFGVLPAGYTGPLVTGKNWGANLSGIRVASGSLKVAQIAGPSFTVGG